jgi:hypothetical protein
MGAVDSSNVVHATNDEVVAIWGPCKIVDLCATRATHVLCSPCLFILKPVCTEGRGWYFTRDPEDHISVVASRCKQFTYRVIESQYELLLASEANTGSGYLLGPSEQH